jgi:hypothetical protein
VPLGNAVAEHISQACALGIFTHFEKQAKTTHSIIFSTGGKLNLNNLNSNRD